MTPDERRVYGYLKSLGLDVCKIPEGGPQKAPDFRVSLDGEAVGYCETKSIRPWPDGEGPDPTFNRLTSDIHRAAAQLDSLNPSDDLFNILTFVNYEPAVDERDLISALTGNFYAESGKLYPLYRKYSHGRIRADKLRIDLYLWFQEGKDQPFKLFNMSQDDRFRRLCSALGTDPDDVVPMD